MTDFPYLPGPFLDLSGRWTPTTQSPDTVCADQYQVDHSTYPPNFQPNLQLPLPDGAGVEQLQSFQYDHALLPTKTANEYAYNASTSSIACSSKHQLDYSLNIQPDLPTRSSCDSGLRPGSPPAGNGVLARSSIDHRTKSPDQRVDAVASQSASQHTPNAELIPRETKEPGRKPDASTSRSLADDSKALEQENKAKKESMMAIIVLDSRKRKRGKLPTRPPDASVASDVPATDTQGPKFKKKNSSFTPNTASRDTKDVSQAMNSTAQPTERLPSPVQLGDGRLLIKYHPQPNMQTDDRNRIAMLESKISIPQHEAAHRPEAAEANHQRDAYEAWQAMLELTCENVILQKEIIKLQHDQNRLRDIVAARDRRIAGLEKELYTWRPVRMHGQT